MNITLDRGDIDRIIVALEMMQAHMTYIIERADRSRGWHVSERDVALTEQMEVDALVEKLSAIEEASE